MLIAGSLGLFLLSIVLVAAVIAKLPADYFLASHEHHFVDPRRYPNLHWFCRVFRNVIGIVLVVAGIAMLVLPGQGILTIVIGIMLMDFPAKHHFLQKLVSKAVVRKSLNLIRQKLGKPPFRYP